MSMRCWRYNSTPKSFECRNWSVTGPGFWTGLSYLLVIQAILQPIQAELQNRSFHYTHPSFVYSPPERWYLHDRDADVAYTNFTNASVALNFTGSAVWVLARTKADRSIFRVLIDDLPPHDLDENGPTWKETSTIQASFQFEHEGPHRFIGYNKGGPSGQDWVSFFMLTVTIGTVEPDVESHKMPPFVYAFVGGAAVLFVGVCIFLGVIYYRGYRNRTLYEATALKDVLDGSTMMARNVKPEVEQHKLL